MLSVKEAQQQILNLQVKIKTKKVPVLDTLGLVLAKDIISDDNIPAYDNSAMDGYAVKAEDILGADKNYPVKLNLLKEDLPAGKVPCRSLKSGYAMSIMTGAPIPQGCSCVVMGEDTQEKGHFVLVFKECREGKNIRYRGEDIKKGDKVLKRGKVIYPGDIGVMASIGKSEVPVIYPPLLGIMTTGNELLEIDSELTMGKVRDSNSYSLAAQVKEVGAYYKKYGIVRDEKEILGKKITEALAECDILLLTGGVSVGNYDFVKEVLGSIGAQLLFWGVNQR
ncbi:MAG: molybdopterin molybdotransferase MoeA, partial [Candidatus Humimicrobiaceae bacterium]